MADPVSIALIAGAAVTAAGTLVGGEMSASAAEAKAAGLRQAATESTAAAQRNSFEQQRQARLALSTLTTRAAAGGAGNDTDTGRLAGDIENRGEYLSLSEMYKGENRARGLLDEADASLFSAKATRTGSYFAAGGKILSGIGAAARGGGPATGDASGPMDISYDAARSYG